MLTASLTLAVLFTSGNSLGQSAGDEMALIGRAVQSVYVANLPLLGQDGKPGSRNLERTVALIELCPSFDELCRTVNKSPEGKLIERRIDLVMRLLQSTDTDSLRGALNLFWARATPRSMEQKLILKQYKMMIPKAVGEEEHTYNSRLLSWAQVVPNIEKFIFVNRILFKPDLNDRRNIEDVFLPIAVSAKSIHIDRLYPVISVKSSGITFAPDIRTWEGAHPYDSRSEFEYYAKVYKRRSKWW